MKKYSNLIFPEYPCTKHELKRLCTCGANTHCSHCGQGSGCYPCQCTPKIELTNRWRKSEYYKCGWYRY